MSNDSIPRKNRKLQVIDLTNEQFEFEDHGMHITGFVASNGKRWFSARIACEVLEIKNVSQALTNIPYKDKSAIITKVYNGTAPVRHLMVTESGLYRLIARSRTEKAIEFQDWLFDTVLPAIYQDGGYIAPNATDEQVKALVSQHETDQKKIADLRTALNWAAVKQGAGRFIEASLPDSDKD
jgi:prophage antirepressor-like protein